jgi:hypothetical protein
MAWTILLSSPTPMITARKWFGTEVVGLGDFRQGSTTAVPTTSCTSGLRLTAEKAARTA